MKKYFLYISIVSICFCFSCQDEDIIDSKPGEAIDPVTNLNSIIADDVVNLSWDLPATFPEDIIEPVSVQVSISVDGKNEGNRILEGAPETFSYSPYQPGIEHKFTVKVVGSVENPEPHESDIRFSLGNTINIFTEN